MIRKILVGLDASNLSQPVLQEAMVLAKACGAELKLLHVLMENEPGAPVRMTYLDEYYYPATRQDLLTEYQRDWNRYVKQSQACLEARVQDASAAGIKATCDQCYGIPGRQICETAKTWPADLVVVGSRGRTGLSEMLLGSVSNYVMHHAPCSVFVVHPKLGSASIPTKEEALTSA